MRSLKILKPHPSLRFLVLLWVPHWGGRSKGKFLSLVRLGGQDRLFYICLGQKRWFSPVVPSTFPLNAMCPVQVNNHDELATKKVGQDDHIFVSSVNKLNGGACISMGNVIYFALHTLSSLLRLALRLWGFEFRSGIQPDLTWTFAATARELK